MSILQSPSGIVFNEAKVNRPLRHLALKSCIADVSLISVDRYRQKCFSHAGRWIDRSAGNLSPLTDVFGLFQAGRKAGWFHSVEVCHYTVLPNKGTAVNKVRVA
jgi:hypothetical protein